MTPDKDLLEMIYNEMKSELVASIDHDIITQIMTATGWHKVQLSMSVDDNEVDEWVKENFKNKYFRHNGSWVIEDLKEYIEFVLRFG
jgi:hypothetical protein